MDQDRRKQRELKRILKQAGSQRRRRTWKRELAVDPESAPDSGEDFGRFGTASRNGLDHDATRRRDRRDEP